MGFRINQRWNDLICFNNEADPPEKGDLPMNNKEVRRVFPVEEACRQYLWKIAFLLSYGILEALLKHNDCTLETQRIR